MTLDRAREILGEDAPKDDRKVELMVDGADRLARLLIEVFRYRRDGANREGVTRP